MLTNAPIKYEYKKMPEGWAETIDSQVFSRSSHNTVVYNTPKYKGTIIWTDDHYIYGELAGCFDWKDETLQASNGHSLHKTLNIPEDYCIRTGKDGWMKLLTRPYFELWLKQDLPAEIITPH